MTRLRRPAGVWIVVAGIMVLIAVHAIGLYIFSSHVALSAMIIGGAVILVVAKHMGLLAPLYALLRRRSRKAP